VLNIPILPSSLLPAAVAQQQGKETQDVPDASELAAMNDAAETMTGDKDDKKFEIVEATIEDIHNAIKTSKITCTELVQQYIDRAKAYNGVCNQLVTEDGAAIPPAPGVVRAGSPLEFPTETIAASEVLPNFDEYVGTPIEFGRMEATASDPSVQQQFGMTVGIPDAGQVNALGTINIRGERSVTCKGEYDAHPSTGALPAGSPEVCEEFRQQPDALERAAELDAQYGSNPPLDEMPMYCIPFSFKDPFDTKDMRSTAGADAAYDIDFPARDHTAVAQLREKGAIIYAKAVLTEYNGRAGNPGGNNNATKILVSTLGYQRSTWAGNPCNPYDTTRAASLGSSSGSGVSVSTNLVMCSLCEESRASCRGPANHNSVALILPHKAHVSFLGGAIGSDVYVDRTGIHCRSIGDAAKVLDALKDESKDPEDGYYDSRDIFTTVPRSSIGNADEPYTTAITDGKPDALSGIRIGIVRESMLTFPDVKADETIVNAAREEIKTILGDHLGATLVESVDPLSPDDPEIENMNPSYSQALVQLLPVIFPDILYRLTPADTPQFPDFADKIIPTEFEPGKVFGSGSMTPVDYMLRMSLGLEPIPEGLNIRSIQAQAGSNTFRFHFPQYAMLRAADWADRGFNETLVDFPTLNERSKFWGDDQRAAFKNWEETDNIRRPLDERQGIDERVKLRELLRRTEMKVIQENDLDVIVRLHTSLQPGKIGLAPQPQPPGNIRGETAFGPNAGLTEVLIPAGYVQTVYDPYFVLSEDKTRYIAVNNNNSTIMPEPGLPFSLVFRAEPGKEDLILEAASAYESASKRRISPPDFGPLPADDSFPIEHMSNSTASAGYGVYSQKPARVEYVTNSSELVGDMIDSITLKMKRVGTINGTAEIGILNEDLSVKKLFGTLDVSTLTSTYTDYEFKLTDELYTIEAGDRIGIKYEGGSLESTSWVSVMLDLEPEDPFDGTNSYLQYYQGTWRNSPDRDLYMTLVQTHG
jgi:Asp-tRNA(Asn)/Glu-tRNA(Gln) amidotransferase A subunit family amidase